MNPLLINQAKTRIRKPLFLKGLYDIKNYLAVRKQKLRIQTKAKKIMMIKNKEHNLWSSKSLKLIAYTRRQSLRNFKGSKMGLLKNTMMIISFYET